MRTLKAAIRRKNRALACVLDADLHCRRRRYATWTADALGTIPPAWAQRRSELEQAYRVAWAELDALRYPRRLATASRRDARARELAALIRAVGTCAESRPKPETLGTVGTFALFGA